MITLPDDAEFFANAKLASIGKLLFTNGIFDKRAGARIDFTPDILFQARVPHHIPEVEPSNVAEVDAFHFATPFPEPGVAAWHRQDMMKAVFGLGSDTMTFETGAGGNGKTKRMAAFQHAFGNTIVHTMNGKDVAIEKFANPGAASPHIMPFRDARIVFLSDPPKDAVLNMSLLKCITGGDPISCRPLHGALQTFRSYAKVFFAVNNMPSFGNDCEASQLNRRFYHLESNISYTDIDEKVNEAMQIYKADDEHVAKMISSAEELIWLMIKEPLRKVPVPDAVIAASKDTIADQDVLKKTFDEHYQAEEGAKVSSAELAATVGVNPRHLATRIVVWGFGKPKVMRIPGKATPCAGYLGVGKKRAREIAHDVGMDDEDDE
jgi:putative DNA primase/helicase